MDAPKEIFIAFCKDLPCHFSLERNHTFNETKYIRADLAELTWEDIRIICTAESDLWEEVCEGKAEDSTVPYYEEVLRRYKEYKKKG